MIVYCIWHCRDQEKVDFCNTQSCIFKESDSSSHHYIFRRKHKIVSLRLPTLCEPVLTCPVTTQVSSLHHRAPSPRWQNKRRFGMRTRTLPLMLLLPRIPHSKHPLPHPHHNHSVGFCSRFLFYLSHIVTKL